MWRRFLSLKCLRKCFESTWRIAIQHLLIIWSEEFVALVFFLVLFLLWGYKKSKLLQTSSMEQRTSRSFPTKSGIFKLTMSLEHETRRRKITFARWCNTWCTSISMESHFTTFIFCLQQFQRQLARNLFALDETIECLTTLKTKIQ
jgi:hypothetical protein